LVGATRAREWGCLSVHLADDLTIVSGSITITMTGRFGKS